MSLESQQSSLLWKVFLAFSTLLIAAILFLFYKVVIRTLLRMNFYRKQGVPCHYFPLIGWYVTGISGLKKAGDAQYYFKMKSQIAPERFLCTNLGFDSNLVLHDPALIKESCLNSDNYAKDNVIMELYSLILGKGLLTSEGSLWRSQRKILSSSFHFEFLKSNLPITQATAHKNLYNIRNTSIKDVNIMNVMQNITGEVIGKIFFGEELEKYQLNGQPLTLALADLIAQIGAFNLTSERHLLGAPFIQKGWLPKHKRLMNKAKTFREICHKIVKERKKSYMTAKQENKVKDMLELLLEYSGDEAKMSVEEIIDQFCTFFLAGMDTTGHLLTMVVYYLDRYPKVKEKVIKEIKECYKIGTLVTMEELNRMDFTSAVLKETLRMMSPVPGLIPRRALKDHKIKDISVRKGDIVNVDFWYNNFNPQYFKEPFIFDPNRWTEKDRLLESYAFIPFSAGPRNCIGQHLAMIESRIILAELLTMYDFKIKEGYNLKMEIKFVYEPADPIMIDLTLRDL